MANLELIKQQTDLLEVCGKDTTLKRVASTGGGEWAGSCPMCGGNDRFRVQPKEGIWMCRHCTGGKWGDCFTYIMERDHVDFKTAVRALGGNHSQRSGLFVRHEPPPKPTYAPPDDAWQIAAREVIKVCSNNLWIDIGKGALAWLHNRGLNDETIKRFQLGFSPGAKIAGMEVWHGIVIPCVVNNIIWYLKVRISQKLIVEGWDKYICVKGSRSAALYNADSIIGDQILFTEGEFDCLLCRQKLGDILSCVTLGGALNSFDFETWGSYLAPVKTAFIAYDLDSAGEKGAVKLLDLLGDRGQYALLPAGDWKDITDFHKAGGDLWKWIKTYLDKRDENS